jgi:HAD superfamily hydrolase (TIGR01490 family)
VSVEIRAALFDIDGTLTTGGEVWAGLLKSPDVLRTRRIWLYMTALPHYFLSRARLVSQAAFRDRWVRLMVWLMTGWSAEQVKHVYETIALDYLVPTLRPDVVTLVKQHNDQGHHVVLVSTMFDGIVQRLAQYVGAEGGLGSRVEMDGGRCTGRIIGETCSGERKVSFARDYLAGSVPEVSLEQCAAYADSASDIAFLAGVGHPVATYPDETMRMAALERGWRIYEG